MTIGILLINTGSPDAPTKAAVYRYLERFLSDRHIISLPKWLWLPLLYGLVLPLRTRRTTKLYQAIWTNQGAPLTNYMRQLKEKLSRQLNLPIAIGMHYGEPFIQEGIFELKAEGVTKIIALPLFPQYSSATTKAAFDKIKDIEQQYGDTIPTITLPIQTYHDDPQYITSLKNTIESYFKKYGRDTHLLFSFHGMPKRTQTQGDPYAIECQKTAALIAEALSLKQDTWTLCYQSRFGWLAWLAPATTDCLKALPKQGIKRVAVICPGFSVDCLETLEEIAIREKEVFLRAGGEMYHYLPALNAGEEHVSLLASLIKRCLLRLK